MYFLMPLMEIEILKLQCVKWYNQNDLIFPLLTLDSIVAYKKLQELILVGLPISLA